MMDRWTSLTLEQVPRLSDEDLCWAVAELVMNPRRPSNPFDADPVITPSPMYYVVTTHRSFAGDEARVPNYLESLGACEPVMDRLDELNIPWSMEPHGTTISRGLAGCVGASFQGSRPRAFLEAVLLARLKWPERFKVKP